MIWVQFPLNPRLLNLVIIFVSHWNLNSAVVPLEEYFPYNSTDALTYPGPPCDDCVSPKIPLRTPFQFFDKVHNYIYLSSNGYITFDKIFNEFRHVCDPKIDVPPMIAPFWADGTMYISNSFSFSDRSDDVVSQKKAAAEIAKAFPDFEDIEISWVFVVTWSIFHQLGGSANNNFQLILASDFQNSFAIFYYNAITWTASRFQGHHHATAGFDANDGNPKHKFSFKNSCLSSIKDTLLSTSNVGYPGKHVVRLDENPNFNSMNCEDWTPDMPLGLKPKLLAMDSQKTIQVRGPCLENGTEVNCLFSSQVRGKTVESKLPGVVHDRRTALCPAPIFYKRDSATLSLLLSAQNLTTEPKTRSGSNDGKGSILVSTIRKAFLKIKSIGPKRNSVELSWDPKKLGNSSMGLALCRHVYNMRMDTFWGAEKLSPPERPLNTGSTFFPKALFADTPRGSTLIVLSLQLGSTCTGTPMKNSPDTLSTDPIDVLETLLDPVEKKMNSSLTFAPCVSDDFDTTGTVLPCPSTEKIIKLDGRFKPHRESFYRNLKDADRCYTQMEVTDSSSSSSNCCYRQNGRILCSQPEHGDEAPSYAQGFHPEVYPWLHMALDVRTWYLCCYLTGFGSIKCRMLMMLMHLDCGRLYKPPENSGGMGDPHFMSLDGLEFTFNGYGEYTLLDTGTCIVQMRLEPYMPPADEVSNSTMVAVGTVITGMAFSCGSDILELLLNMKRTGIQPLVNRAPFQFPDDLSGTAISGGIYLGLAVENDTISYKVGFQNDAFQYSLDVVAGSLSVLGGSNCIGFTQKTSGLGGDCDGNPDNDLRPKGGEPLPKDSSLRVIHYRFGETWRVTNTTTLFSYAYGTKRSYDAANHPEYKPRFTVPNASEFSPDVQGVCGNDNNCYFDYQATGSLLFAKGTVETKERQLAIKEALQGGRRGCETFGTVDNGTMVVNGSGVGAVATLVCDPGFLPDGAGEAVCGPDGKWDTEELCCWRDCWEETGFVQHFFCDVLRAARYLLGSRCKSIFFTLANGSH